MKLVYSLHNYPPIHNAGAETMAHAINRWLAGRGHSIEVVSRQAVAGVADWEGITVRKRGPIRWFDRSFAAADVALTHLDETAIAVAAAARTGTPLGHVLHNDRWGTWERIPDNAALLVSNTEWIASRIPERLAGVPVAVVYPPTLDVEECPLEDDRRDAVTLVNLLEAKGAPLFYTLAERAPHRPFLGVTGAYGAQLPPPPLPNLRTFRNRADMRPTWSRTRVLVAPSIYESFGKAAVEALAHGIPVIAHPTDGLVESLGEAGIFADRDDVDAWLEALEALDDPTEYAARSRKARRTRARAGSDHPPPARSPRSRARGRAPMIVTGAGHCGTGWAAAVLNAAGVKCGHENVWNFRPETAGRWGDFKAEASWPAAAHDLTGYRLLHLVRDPVDWAASMHAIRFWSDTCEHAGHAPGAHLRTPYAQLVDRTVGIVQLPTEADRLAAHWYLWNTRIVDGYGPSWRLTVNVERLWADPELAAAAFAWLAGRPVVTPDHVRAVGKVNEHRRGAELPATIAARMRPLRASQFENVPGDILRPPSGRR